MDHLHLADLLFPQVTKTPEDVEALYPPRNLPEGAKVTRFAPSPTGFVHFGGLFPTTIGERLAHQSGGVFYLRIEDTDAKREVPGAAEGLIRTLARYGIHFDEGAILGEDGKVADHGAYGPYKQSLRGEIYHVFAKKLVAEGKAYPVFTTQDELNALNAELAALPVCNWKGVKIVTSGIICDNPALLQIFEENNIAIAADDVAHETRSFRTDAPEDEADPIRALALQFTAMDYDILLFDPKSNENRRGEFVANLVKESGAQGLVLFMQQFCDPEEMEYPYLKKALDAAGVPHIKLGVDQQMRDFGQASTAIQAFADVL